MLVTHTAPNNASPRANEERRDYQSKIPLTDHSTSKQPIHSATWRYVPKRIKQMSSDALRLATLFGQSKTARIQAEETSYTKSEVREKIKENEAIIRDRTERYRIPDNELVPALEMKNGKLWDKLSPVEQSLGKTQSEQVNIEQEGFKLKERIERNAKKIDACEDLDSEECSARESDTSSGSGMSSQTTESIQTMPPSPTMESIFTKPALPELKIVEHSKHISTLEPLFIGTKSEIDLMETSTTFIGIPDFESINPYGHREAGIYVQSMSFEVVLAYIGTEFDVNHSTVYSSVLEIQEDMDLLRDKRRYDFNFPQIGSFAGQLRAEAIEGVEEEHGENSDSPDNQTPTKSISSLSISSQGIKESSLSNSVVKFYKESEEMLHRSDNTSTTPATQNVFYFGTEGNPPSSNTERDPSMVFDTLNPLMKTNKSFSNARFDEPSSWSGETKGMYPGHAIAQSEDIPIPAYLKIDGKMKEQGEIEAEAKFEKTQYLITYWFSPSNRVNRWILHGLMARRCERLIYFKYLPSEVDPDSLRLTESPTPDFLKTWDTDAAAMAVLFRSESISEVTTVVIMMPEGHDAD